MGSASRDCCSLQTVSDQRLSERCSNERLPGTLSARAMTGCRFIPRHKICSILVELFPLRRHVADNGERKQVRQ